MQLFRRFKPSTRKDLTTAAAIVSILLTGICMFAMYIFVHGVESQNKDDFSQQQTDLLHDTSIYIHNKLANYGQILLAGAATVHVKGADALTASDWQTYAETTHAISAFPELLSIGYVQHTEAANVPALTESMRARGDSDFTIWPMATRPSYEVLKFAQPASVINQRAVGYDIGSEAQRNASMSYARDKADFALSPPVVLERDRTNGKHPPQSVILFYPIYTGGTPPTTIEARRQSLQGYVYVAFRIKEMMTKRNENLAGQPISYELFDATRSQRESLYQYASTKKMNGHVQTVGSDVQVISRKWRIEMTIPDTVASKSFGRTLLFLAGLLGSALLGFAVFMLLRWRIGSVKNEYEKDIENTKDELLALASHQLRTPATGVKQYLGMLLDGLFGDIDPEQRTLIDKAYQANDLQLEIIDQLLYVAKADAGQLIVRHDAVDLRAVVRSTIDNMKASAKLKQVTIRATLPPKARIKGDERLIRMITENLISNAVKYSYPGKTVTVSLRMQKKDAVLRVRDHGVGISEDDYPKLFQKFTRVSNELTAEVEGSGLGLYLSAKLAEAHGGGIAVSSKPQKGSVFTVRLPIEPPNKHSVVQLTEKIS